MLCHDQDTVQIASPSEWPEDLKILSTCIFDLSIPSKFFTHFIVLLCDIGVELNADPPSIW